MFGGVVCRVWVRDCRVERKGDVVREVKRLWWWICAVLGMVRRLARSKVWQNAVGSVGVCDEKDCWGVRSTAAGAERFVLAGVGQYITATNDVG